MMGVEFIGKAKDSYQKGWARGVQELRVADLFTLKPEERRTILVRPQIDAGFCPEDTYIVHVDGPEIHIYSQHRLVGMSVNPPQSVLNRIQELGGKTIGILHATREHSGLVDVAVDLRSNDPA